MFRVLLGSGLSCHRRGGTKFSWWWASEASHHRSSASQVLAPQPGCRSDFTLRLGARRFVAVKALAIPGQQDPEGIDGGRCAERELEQPQKRQHQGEPSAPLAVLEQANPGGYRRQRDEKKEHPDEKGCGPHDFQNFRWGHIVRIRVI